MGRGGTGIACGGTTRFTTWSRYGLGERNETLQFTYVAQSPHLSGYKNTDGDVETLLSTDHFVATYYDPECPP
jgi:hypothetical protein